MVGKWGFAIRDSYYAAPVSQFCSTGTDEILGGLAAVHHHALEHEQRGAWLDQIGILQSALSGLEAGWVFIEFLIPRMGKRADVVILYRGAVFVLEFKVGSERYHRGDIDQAVDYCLDLKNFHLGSHQLPIIPVLVSTKASVPFHWSGRWSDDRVADPVCVNASGVGRSLEITLPTEGSAVDVAEWRGSGYRPTPTIIEAAEVLYATHSVTEISRSDAGAKNLAQTSKRIEQIVERSKSRGEKAVCFVTGVPGAGKTLAGLNIAALRQEADQSEHAVFLSGNGPLVDVLREALARDQAEREGAKKSDAARAVKRFVQNIHHFRDHYVGTLEVPFEKVVVFDEAQRAWDNTQTSKFMQQKRDQADFNMSEPEFLISVMDRHFDWCTVVCLIGGGQEINTGEAGLREWLEALNAKFSDWVVYGSDLLDTSNYTIDETARKLISSPGVQKDKNLHLQVSMRSFRAEKLSQFVSLMLDGDAEAARETFAELAASYPIVLTRDINEAKAWLRSKARGSERFGLVASSGALRLRPEGIHVKSKIDPAVWFLNGKDDVRSSFYLEEVATQFDVQGLELDWCGVCWDADLRMLDGDWSYHAFKGTKWQNVRDEAKRRYLLNTYRVLLTRARQGMVIFVPQGDRNDTTRPPEFYNGVFDFLKRCGVEPA